MQDALPIQTSFAAGELSPRMHNRVDVDAYFAGAAEMTNFIALPHGPMVKRMGTKYVAGAISRTSSRLIPFKFSTTQSFVLHLGVRDNKGLMRIFYNGGILTNPDGSIYEVQTPFNELDWYREFSWTQSGDVMWIAHRFYAPTRIQRYGNNDWRIDQPFTAGAETVPKEWSVNNWPGTVVYHEQRLVFGGSPSHPLTLWFSEIGDYLRFRHDRKGETADPPDPVLDTDPLTYTIASDMADGITWMHSMDVLLVGTGSAEFRVAPSSLGESLTPSNTKVTRQTNYGSAKYLPSIQLGSSVLFIQRDAKRVRSLDYSVIDNQFTATDLTIYADHIFRYRAIRAAYMSSPDTYLWVLTYGGELLCMTYEKQQKVLAWTKHLLSNKEYRPDAFATEVGDICVVPGPEGDQLWLLVDRRNSPWTTVEYIDKIVNENPDFSKEAFLDCRYKYAGAATKTITGLQVLQDMEVTVVTDGWVHPPVRVSRDGVINLEQEVKQAIIGVPIHSRFKSMVIQAPDQVTTGASRKITAVTISLLNSLGLKYGVDGQKLQEKYFGPTKVMNKAQTLFTGDFTESIPASNTDAQQFVIEHSLPYPLMVRALTYHITPRRVN